MARGFASMAGIALAAALAGSMTPAVTSAPTPVEARAVLPASKPKAKPRRKAPKGWRATYRPNGKREVSRRLRQIAAGQITVSNGLAA